MGRTITTQTVYVGGNEVWQVVNDTETYPDWPDDGPPNELSAKLNNVQVERPSLVEMIDKATGFVKLSDRILKPAGTHDRFVAKVDAWVARPSDGRYTSQIQEAYTSLDRDNKNRAYRYVQDLLSKARDPQGLARDDRRAHAFSELLEMFAEIDRELYKSMLADEHAEHKARLAEEFEARGMEYTAEEQQVFEDVIDELHPHGSLGGNVGLRSADVTQAIPKYDGQYNPDSPGNTVTAD